MEFKLKYTVTGYLTPEFHFTQDEWQRVSKIERGDPYSMFTWCFFDFQNKVIVLSSGRGIENLDGHLVAVFLSAWLQVGFINKEESDKAFIKFCDQQASLPFIFKNKILYPGNPLEMQGEAAYADEISHLKKLAQKYADNPDILESIQVWIDKFTGIVSKMSDISSPSVGEERVVALSN